jgi:hypothetical protein
LTGDSSHADPIGYRRGASRRQAKTYVHEDFPNYYTALLSKLEEAFDIHLSHENLDFDQKSLFMLFVSTVHSYQRITTPWSGYLEAGLLIRHLEEAGEPGRRVFAASDAIRDIMKANQAAHFEMLYALFEGIYGFVDRVVDSEQLQEMGFDDSKEPQMHDYYDYI